MASVRIVEGRDSQREMAAKAEGRDLQTSAACRSVFARSARSGGGRGGGPRSPAADSYWLGNRERRSSPRSACAQEVFLNVSRLWRRGGTSAAAGMSRGGEFVIPFGLNPVLH